MLTSAGTKKALPLERVGTEDAHLDPLLNQVAHAWVGLTRTGRAAEVCKAKEVELGAKGDEVGEEAVEVALAAQVDQVRELSVVDVGKDAEQLLVDVLGRGQKCRGEFAS